MHLHSLCWEADIDNLTFQTHSHFRSSFAMHRVVYVGEQTGKIYPKSLRQRKSYTSANRGLDIETIKANQTLAEIPRQLKLGYTQLYLSQQLLNLWPGGPIFVRAGYVVKLCLFKVLNLNTVYIIGI